MEIKNLILIGGGGHCKSVIDVAENAGFNIIGILDTPENVGKKVLDYTIIGSDELIPAYVEKALFLVTVGQIKNVKLRITLHEKVYKAGGSFATVISPTAHVSKYAVVEEGSVIMHQAVVNADANVGIGCIINTFANIEHDAIIKDFCHISTGAMVNGNCTVGRGCFIGSLSVLVNGISITDECVIAAGATVRKDILRKGIYSGNPAKLIIKL
jgi:sugar O-acyltransferase (sialic acid O-acetyltransferase NeuD family)